MTLKEELVKIGFTEDYEIPFNLSISGLDLLRHIEFGDTEADHKDLIWLSNQLAEIFQDDPSFTECQDNFRACRSDEYKSTTSGYDTLQAHGCCGFYDELFTNPETGNHFWIGFNYGH